MAQLILEKALVKFVGPVTQVTATVKKRILILTEGFDTEYPTPIKIEALNAKCDDAVLNEIIPGDLVSVTANVRGNEWLNPKTGVTEVINSFNLWKLNLLKTQKTASTGTAPVYAPPSAPPADLMGVPATNVTPAGLQDEEDDLPF